MAAQDQQPDESYFDSVGRVFEKIPSKATTEIAASAPLGMGVLGYRLYNDLGKKK